MQCKVGTPGLNARIEQESKGMSMEVKGAEIATFMTIASPTGECQILCRCYATVFLRDDVVNFMREESHTDWKQALLAVLSSPLYYKPAEFYGNIAQAHWAPVREGSVPALSITMRCSMRSYSSSSAISAGVISPAI